MDNENEFIDLDKLINESSTKFIDEPNNTTASDQFEKIYQIQCKKNNPNAIIKKICDNAIRQIIVLHEFKFNNFICRIVSYLLSDVDIKEANDVCSFKIIGLLLINNNKVIGSLTMSFYTFIHKKEKKDIFDYISKDVDIPLPGFFAFDLKYFYKGSKKSERIGDILEKFPGKTQSIYSLINLLSNDKILFLYKTFQDH